MNFDEIYRRHYAALFRYVCRLTGDVDTAEDATQEAFLSLLRRDLPENEAKPWLFTVATNYVRDGARRAETRRRLGPKVEQLSSQPARPDELTERREAVDRVRGVLDRLPERDRKILLLREEGFSYREIAATIDVAASSVGTLIARALRRFAVEYRNENGNDASS
ncbi:MAG: sigma-70 family RNA polymerase sigma factor [Gemmatimonadota bacterium]